MEPAWGGLRVVVALTRSDATVHVRGEMVAVPDELRRALVQAFRAEEAVVEGHLTAEALRSGEGAFPGSPQLERPAILVPRGLLQRVRNDPAARAREHAARELAGEREAREELERGEPQAFVAIDLLWLDGQSLEGLPLLERKRWLEAILEPSPLVRVTTFVRSTAGVTLAGWGSIGFRELSYRAANSRYLTGRENPDWALGRAADGPAGR